MAAMSNYLKQALINESVRNTGYTPAGTVYIALYTATPTAADTGTELSTGSYARRSIAFIAPTLGVTSNSALITFPTSTANWGIVTHFGIRDSLTAGNLLYYGTLTTARTLVTGDTLTVPIGNIVLTLA
jgi:hypothetical protein